MTEPERPGPALIEVDGVSFSPGGQVILEDVSLRVAPGDFLALIGPNGSGKTTLIRIILGLLKPHAGTVRIQGEELPRFRRWDLLGYVPQRMANLDPFFPASAREVVALGLLSRERFPGFSRREDKAAVAEALALVGMEDQGERRIGRLSGGQQQRVLIARALASRPALLVLDEPTAGVDTPTQKQFYDMLDRLNRERGITLLLVTHDIGVVTKYVRQVACLNQRLTFHGSHDEFCASPQLVGLFGPEAHVICHNH